MQVYGRGQKHMRKAAGGRSPGGWLLVLLLGGVAVMPAGCRGVAAAAYPVPPGPTAGTGAMCKAGVYSCDLPVRAPLGSPCSCPGLGAASYGNVH
jgi:hypothetical protein